MIPELEQVVTFFQNSEAAKQAAAFTAMITYGAVTCAGGTYIVLKFDKHVGPIITGLLVYPVAKRHNPDINLIDFLKEAHQRGQRLYHETPSKSNSI